MLLLGLFLMVVSTSVIVTQSHLESPSQEVPTTHMTKVTTSETEAPLSKSEPTQNVENVENVENENRDGDQPVVHDSQNNEGKSVKEKEGVVKSEQQVTEQERKGLVKEGSRQEPPIPFDPKEAADKGEEIKQPAEEQLHEKATQGKETNESRIEHEAHGPGKVVVDEEEQKKLLNRLNILEQKVDQLSDGKKKEKGGESEAASKDTDAVIPQHSMEGTADNGSQKLPRHDSHVKTSVNWSSEHAQIQPVGGEEHGQQGDDERGDPKHFSPTPVPGGEDATAGDGNRSKRTESHAQAGLSLAVGALNKENGPDVKADDSHNKDKGAVPDNEHSPKKEGGASEEEVFKDSNPEAKKEVTREETQDEENANDNPPERATRDVGQEGAPEQVNGDRTPPEEAQDTTLPSETDDKEGEGNDKLQDSVTLGDGTTANSDL